MEGNSELSESMSWFKPHFYSLAINKICNLSEPVSSSIKWEWWSVATYHRCGFQMRTFISMICSAVCSWEPVWGLRWRSQLHLNIQKALLFPIQGTCPSTYGEERRRNIHPPNQLFHRISSGKDITVSSRFQLLHNCKIWLPSTSFLFSICEVMWLRWMSRDIT